MTIIEAFGGWRYNQNFIRLQKLKTRRDFLTKAANQNTEIPYSMFLDLKDTLEEITETEIKLNFWRKYANGL